MSPGSLVVLEKKGLAEKYVEQQQEQETVRKHYNGETMGTPNLSAM